LKHAAADPNVDCSLWGAYVFLGDGVKDAAGMPQMRRRLASKKKPSGAPSRSLPQATKLRVEVEMLKHELAALRGMRAATGQTPKERW